jgi:FAD/FMN-containing dehydrogenase
MNDGPADDGLLERLRSVVGEEGLRTQAQDLAPALRDWRGRFTGAARALVLPVDTAQASAVLALCHARRIPVVPQGGNTGLAGGATPDAQGRAIVLSTRRLRRIRAVDPHDDTLTAEAGCLLAEVQQAAREAGRLFPLSLAAEGSCTLGGNLATNAGGTQVLRYGNARELTLGIEAVLPDGSVFEGLRGLRKDNSGYDLKQLFIGSEGTLGVITAATLRLFTPPADQAVALAGVASLEQAVALLGQARERLGPALTAFELMSSDCLALLARQTSSRLPPLAAHPWCVLLEAGVHNPEARAADLLEQLGTEALERGRILDMVLARSLAEQEALWAMREGIPGAQARAGGNVKHDVSLPVTAMASVLARIGTALRAIDPCLQPLVFGHLGDGNLHLNVGVVPGQDAARAFALEAQINAVVFDAVLASGGSFSAEHGVGQLRRELARRTLPPVHRSLMAAVKQALDPLGIMNPGKGVA